MPEVAEPKPGDRIVIDVRGGPDETLAWDTTIAESCYATEDVCNTGGWYCDTCRTGLAHNLAASSHHEHRLVWICDKHGPEAPE